MAMDPLYVQYLMSNCAIGKVSVARREQSNATGVYFDSQIPLPTRSTTAQFGIQQD
ncbi:hypothetical protein AEP_01544 [Curvibacter sp. AEP1-3]|nr:hypothetical protein AEP_01544 [Curvibacter sp. AEP1-3]